MVEGAMQSTPSPRPTRRARRAPAAAALLAAALLPGCFQTPALDQASQAGLSMRLRDGLGVWSRDEVVRVDLEGRSVPGPGVADRLERGPPAQRLEVLGEVVGPHEGEDMRLQRLEAGVVEGLDGGLLDGAVHPLRLTIGPRVVGLGQPVLDAVLAADAVEDVPHPPGRRP